MLWVRRRFPLPFRVHAQAWSAYLSVQSRCSYLYGTHTPTVERERGVLCRRVIIHVELRTRRVARHGDRHRNDRARSAAAWAQAKVLFSRLVDAHVCTPPRQELTLIYTTRVRYRRCAESPAIASSLETLTMHARERKNRWKIRLTFAERVSQGSEGQRSVTFE